MTDPALLPAGTDAPSASASHSAPALVPTPGRARAFAVELVRTALFVGPMAAASVGAVHLVHGRELAFLPLAVATAAVLAGARLLAFFLRGSDEDRGWSTWLGLSTAGFFVALICGAARGVVPWTALINLLWSTVFIGAILASAIATVTRRSRAEASTYQQSLLRTWVAGTGCAILAASGLALAGRGGLAPSAGGSRFLIEALPPIALLGMVPWAWFIERSAAPLERQLRDPDSSSSVFAAALAAERLPFRLAATTWIFVVITVGAASGIAARWLGLSWAEARGLLSLSSLFGLAAALFSVARYQALLAPLAPSVDVDGEQRLALARVTPSVLQLGFSALLLVGLSLALHSTSALRGGALPLGLAAAAIVLGRRAFQHRASAAERRLVELSFAAEHGADAASSEPARRNRLEAALAELVRSLRARRLYDRLAQERLEKAAAARTAELSQRNQELVSALDELSKTQAALVEAERLASAGRVLASLAHEINNPLNAVKNSTLPLRETLVELAALSGEGSGASSLATLEEAGEMLRVIKRGSERTAEIVRALDQTSDGESEPLTAVDLAKSCDEALALVVIPDGLSLLVDRQYQRPCVVSGRAGELGRVLVNLLSNAIQAVAQRRATDADYRPRLGLAVRMEAEEALISVEDNGPGIDKSALGQLFEPFFTTKAPGHGSGLGLFLAHGLVARHGGRITVASQPGAGARFTVHLPQRAVDYSTNGSTARRSGG